MRIRLARIYKGVAIFPADRNSSGIRWSARLDNGDVLRADTLEGIRQLITTSLMKRSHDA